jgi:Lysophospholipase L1 and related esterases
MIRPTIYNSHKAQAVIINIKVRKSISWGYFLLFLSSGFLRSVGLTWLLLCALQIVTGQQTSPPIYFSNKNFIHNLDSAKNWHSIAAAIKHRNKNITIVHIGDSHIQGGYFTNRFRELMAQSYSIKERGFVFPYSLIKANGPEDVRFYSTNIWDGQKYNHSSGSGRVGIAGYHLVSNERSASIAIVLKQKSDSLYPFQKILVYHDQPSLLVTARNGLSNKPDSVDKQLYVTTILLGQKTDSLVLRFQNKEAQFHLFGIELKYNKPGITYHSIGVNGSGFETFSHFINYLPILKTLKPNLVIVSLGTNDCYLQKVDTVKLKKEIAEMIANIRVSCPGSCILLTTPGDHLLHKKYINEQLFATSTAIKSVANENGCLYWDFWEVMGGLGSSKRWHQHGLMYKDIIHLSKEGYRLQGELFFKAFAQAIESGK